MNIVAKLAPSLFTQYHVYFDEIFAALIDDLLIEEVINNPRMVILKCLFNALIEFKEYDTFIHFVCLFSPRWSTLTKWRTCNDRKKKKGTPKHTNSKKSSEINNSPRIYLDLSTN